MNRSALAVLLAAAFSATACASAGAQGVATPADPLEPLNRAVFAFNEALDDTVAEPVARAYSNVVPEVFRVTIGNVFSNARDLWTSVNQLLQGKPREAASDFSRFFLNTTYGFIGFADIATPLGFEKHREDFGQTLGRWGVGPGPYLVLPLFGASSLRDGAGLVFDVTTDPLSYANDSVSARNTTIGLRLVDNRAGLLRAGQVLEGAALDKYSFVRDGYLQRRINLIWDGDPPARLEPDPDPKENQ